MYETIYISDNQQEFVSAIRHRKQLNRNSAVATSENVLDSSEEIAFLHVPLNENELSQKTYQYMVELTHTTHDLDFFLSKYKDFYMMIKMKYMIEFLKNQYDVNHFFISEHPYNRLLKKELKKFGINLDFYSAEPENNLANLSFKRRIGEWLLNSQHKTYLYPNIVLNRDFYRVKKALFFGGKGDKNALLIVSSHINYPRVLIPFEKLLLDNGYRVYYLAQTKRVANYVKDHSSQPVIGIQDFVTWTNLLRRNMRNLTFETKNEMIRTFVNENTSKIVEMDKYYNAFHRLLEHNRIDLVMTADDVEPFGRGFIRYAKRHGVKTVNVQHGYIADPYNYSSTISDYMLTWDKISSDVIRKLKRSETKLVDVGPPHLNQIKRVNKEVKRVTISWFPIPTKVTSEIRNVRKLFEGIQKAIQQNWDDESVRLIVKLHPYDSLAKYQNVANQFTWNENIEVNIYQHGQNPIEVISQSDFIIALNTSVVYEAYLLGVPVVGFNLLKEEENPLLQSYYDNICHEQSELQTYMKTALGRGQKFKVNIDQLVDWEKVRQVLVGD